MRDGNKARERSRRASLMRADADRRRRAARQHDPADRAAKKLQRQVDDLQAELLRLSQRAARDENDELRGMAELIRRLPKPKLEALIGAAEQAVAAGRGGMAACVLAAWRNGQPEKPLLVVPERPKLLGADGSAIHLGEGGGPVEGARLPP